jgi:two-component system, LytTR family, sensor kinase
MLVQEFVTGDPNGSLAGRYTRAAKVMLLPNNSDLQPEPLSRTASARRFAWMVLVVFSIWTAIGVMNTLQRIANTTDMRESFPLLTLIKLGMGTHWLKAILSLPLILFVERFPLRAKAWKTGVLLHLVALVVYTAAFILLRPYAVPTIYFGDNVPKVMSFWEANYIILRSFLLDIIYGFLLTVLGAYLWQYALRLRNTQLMQERLQTRLIRAELHALKMQLQPHFLFNTLHTISNLAPIDSSKAQLMIARLGELLRISLEHVSSEAVPLRRELEFLGGYLEIERVRFEDRLKVVMDVDDAAMNAEIPNMILQPLVENAICHGINKKAQGGVITIRGRRQSNRILIEIADDGGEVPSEDHVGWGIGLSNTKARLQQLYGMDFSFEIQSTNTGTSVRFDIPYLTMQQNLMQESAVP